MVCLDGNTLELDAWIDQYTATLEPPVETEEPASSDSPPASVEAVADQPEIAATEAVESPPVAEAVPQPDIAAQLEAMQAQLAGVSQEAEQFRQLRAAAEQMQRQREEEARFADWQKRFEDAENYAPEQKQRIIGQLVNEVQAHRASEYQAQVQERESVAEDAAKAFAAWYTVAQNALSPDQFTALEADAKHLLQLGSPDAMKSQIARDKALETRGYERAKAEIAKATEAAMARKAQERIASNADLVGAGAGTPAKGDPNGSIDDFIDSFFA